MAARGSKDEWTYEPRVSLHDDPFITEYGRGEQEQYPTRAEAQVAAEVLMREWIKREYARATKKWKEAL